MPHTPAPSSRHARRVLGSSFIGSAFEGPSQGRVTLRGALDADAVDRLSYHLQGFLDAGTRLLTLDATDLIAADPCLVELLGRTQQRLGDRAGLLTVTGLRSGVLPEHLPGTRPLVEDGSTGAVVEVAAHAWTAVRVPEPGGATARAGR